MDIAYWKRDRRAEMAYRCAIIEGGHIRQIADKAIDMLGADRAVRVPPIDASVNPIRRLLGVISRVYDPAPAVQGLSPAFADILGDASAWTRREDLESIQSVPMPTSLLLGGGEYGGLRRALEYLQVCDYVGVACGWSARTQRPYIRIVRPCNLDVTYASDDPSVVVGVSEDRQRMISGVMRDVTDVWDMRDVGHPNLRITIGSRDVTADIEGLDTSQLSGDGYWWRLKDGAPYIPIVVYGCIGSAMQNIHLTEGVLGAGVNRTCLAGAMLDSGFPGRNVRGMISGQDHQPGTSGLALLRGDVRAWRDGGDGSAPEHWEWAPGADVEALFRVCHMYETDLVSQLGVPVELSATGGEPLAHEMEEQENAIQRWYDPCRSGDVEVLRDLSAIWNRAMSGREPESGHGVLYRGEIEKAIERKRGIDADNRGTDGGNSGAQGEAGEDV